jgi:two-component system phosphate regulon sensor histidine kinase PhoR
VDALTQMATELLELSRIESGQVPLELRPVSAGNLIASAAERMRTQAERAGLSLRVTRPPEPCLVQADLPRLEQVLVNLVHNAIKFTPPGGEVSLSARLEGQVVCFTVQDTGAGIPADDLERIFERFYKADRARSSGGTGLGLSISRHLVEAHGGRIWAESVEGRGSQFHFTLPLS